MQAILSKLPPPRLLFLPGAGGDRAFWRPLGDRLPATWEKIYFGWPGLGAQPPSPTVNSWDDLVSLVEAEIGDKPVDLLAQSMGGAIALQLALKHPQKVRRLVLAVTSGGVDMGGVGAADWRSDYQQAFPAAASWIYDQPIDLTDEIAQITQPTLLLWGDHDPISPIGVGERLAGLLPNAVLEVVPQGDHGFVCDRPEAIVDDILGHLTYSSPT
jgi:pimeloyl-ACP methyl ester carboxylesterase